MRRAFSAPHMRVAGKPVVLDVANPWEGTPYENVDMANPLYEDHARQIGEKEAAIFVDGSHHIPHGARQGTRHHLAGSDLAPGGRFDTEA
ncbi:MAG: hypothetical protein ACE5NA_00045 [Nitrospiraceae bacterium]